MIWTCIKEIKDKHGKTLFTPGNNYTQWSKGNIDIVFFDDIGEEHHFKKSEIKHAFHEVGC